MNKWSSNTEVLPSLVNVYGRVPECFQITGGEPKAIKEGFQESALSLSLLKTLEYSFLLKIVQLQIRLIRCEIVVPD